MLRTKKFHRTVCTILGIALTLVLGAAQPQALDMRATGRTQSTMIGLLARADDHGNRALACADDHGNRALAYADDHGNGMGA